MYEELLKTIQKRQIEIENLQGEQKKDLELLAKMRDEDIDLVSVKKASLVFDLSLPKIYELVNSGKLKRHEMGGKLYISKKELLEKA